MYVQSVVRARSDVEAAWLIYEGKPGTRLIAGGTDLMLQMWRGQAQASALVDLRTSGMDHIRETPEAIYIGATASIESVARHPGVREHHAGLHQAAATLASLQIRNMGTLGGNIGNASPAADLVPPLLALGATVWTRCGDQLREWTLHELLKGPGQTALSPHEMITEVRVPKVVGEGRAYSRFFKLGFRGAQIIAVVNLALSARLHDGRADDIRLALGSVAPTVVRARSAERCLQQGALDRDRVREASEALQEDIHPIDDLRASASYRRRVARNFVRLALQELRAAGVQESS